MEALYIPLFCTTVIAAILLLIVGCAKRHPLALWIAETLVMGAVFALIKSMFGVKGSMRGYTSRPRLRR